MKKKALIGIIPLVDKPRESYWMLPGYMKLLSSQGALPLMLPLTDEAADLDQLAALCDGFLFSGGHDVSPEVYQASAQVDNLDTCPERDAMEKALLTRVLALDKPVLGICRGLQFINAVLGGSLYQDLPTQAPSAVNHHQDPPYDAPVHDVELVKEGSLYRLLGKERLAVNSLHHQAVKDLAPALKAMAFSPDGLVEAAELPEKAFVWALQWHPEFAYLKDEASRRIAEAFVDACREGMS